MKVYLNDQKHPGKRIVMEADVLEDRKTTIQVKLHDKHGSIIVRKKKRDLANETAKETSKS